MGLVISLYITQQWALLLLKTQFRASGPNSHISGKEVVPSTFPTEEDEGNTDGILANKRLSIGIELGLSSDLGMNQTLALFQKPILQGSVVAAAAGSVVPSTITVHELEAVEVGLKLASEKGVRRLMVATDSTTVVHLLKPRTTCPWHVVQLLRRIEARRAIFEEVIVKHVFFREANRAADHLSKLLPTSEYIEILESSFSEDFKKILYDDKAGTIYLRL